MVEYVFVLYEVEYVFVLYVFVLYVFVLQIDIFIVLLMIKCCDQYDFCYDMCNFNKDKCDSDFKVCFFNMCKKMEKLFEKDEFEGMLYI